MTTTTTPQAATITFANGVTKRTTVEFSEGKTFVNHQGTQYVVRMDYKGLYFTIQGVKHRVEV